MTAEEAIIFLSHIKSETVLNKHRKEALQVAIDALENKDFLSCMIDELGDDKIRGLISSEIDKMEKWIKDNQDCTPIGPSYKPVDTGWICPKCGRSLSPLTKVCPCSERWEVTC